MLAAANVYVQMNAPLQPPFFARTVHPASPSEITVHDKKIDLDAGDNPFRQLEKSNPQEFRKHVENGRKVYYRNCVFCHGDNMSANGMFVARAGPDPDQLPRHDPAASGDVSVLANLQGRPRPSRRRGALGYGHARLGEFLKEEEMWDAILFLYDFTELKPRAKEEATAK